MSHGWVGYGGCWLRKGHWQTSGCLFFAPQYNVDSAAAAMARMRLPDAGDAVGIGARFQPMTDLSTDRAAPGVAIGSRRFWWFAGNDQQDTLIANQGG